MFKGLVEHDIGSWSGRGSAPFGPQADGTLRCLGGCGGVIGIFPRGSVWINRNLAWCASCAARFMDETGEDPCFPRHDRERQVAMILMEGSGRQDCFASTDRREEVE